MPLDRTTTRHDIGYIRRRPKAAESAAVAPTAASGARTGGLSFDRPDRAPQAPTAPPATAPALSSGGGLSLKRQDRETPAAQPSTAMMTSGGTGLAMGAKAQLSVHTVPYFQKNIELTLDDPAVRFDVRQSAIGSLTVEGAQAFAWETTDKMGGLEVRDGNSTDVKPPKYGNRQLVEFIDGNVVLGLRHFRHLRRLVVGSQQRVLKASLYGGSQVVIDTDGGNNVLLVSRIDNELECRIEKINSVDLLGVFGIKVSKVSIA